MGRDVHSTQKEKFPTTLEGTYSFQIPFLTPLFPLLSSVASFLKYAQRELPIGVFD